MRACCAGVVTYANQLDLILADRAADLTRAFRFGVVTHGTAHVPVWRWEIRA